jgi:hypothetical protein
LRWKRGRDSFFFVWLTDHHGQDSFKRMSDVMMDAEEKELLSQQSKHLTVDQPATY